MELRELVAERRAVILDRWFASVIETYSPDARGLFGGGAGRFANPVGTTIREALGRILDGLFTDDAAAAVAAPIGEIVRVRAIQDFSPSRAVAFVFALKEVLSEEMARVAAPGFSGSQIARLHARVDALALAAFDAWAVSREKAWALRSEEWRNRMFRLLQKANLLGEVADEPPVDEPPAGGPSVGEPSVGEPELPGRPGGS